MRYYLVLVLISLVQSLHQAYAAPVRYGETLCISSEYSCLKIRRGDTWAKLFPEEEERDLVMRVNRMNTRLRPGILLAIPKNIERLTLYDISPFPRHIEPIGEKIVVVSQQKLAWAAYDISGELVWWGPVSSGMGKCVGALGNCETPTGSFRVIRKQDIDCLSTVFPRRAGNDSGGAIMPYCMHFYRGYALHGSDEVPGYRASHGCVRMFTEDARWLNEDFIDLPGEGMKGTRVVLDAAENKQH